MENKVVHLWKAEVRRIEKTKKKNYGKQWRGSEPDKKMMTEVVWKRKKRRQARMRFIVF